MFVNLLLSRFTYVRFCCKIKQRKCVILAFIVNFIKGDSMRYCEMTEDEMLELQKKNKKRKKRIITSSIAIFLLIVYFIFYGANVVRYEDMYGGIKPVNEDGIIYFDFYLTDKPFFRNTCINSSLAVFDYETGIAYSYSYMQVSARRCDIYFSKGIQRSHELRLYEDGYIYDGGDPNDRAPWSFNPKTDYRANRGLMQRRVLRVFYMDGNGKMTEVWSLPNADEIEARSETPIGEPSDYIPENELKY